MNFLNIFNGYKKVPVEYSVQEESTEQSKNTDKKIDTDKKNDNCEKQISLKDFIDRCEKSDSISENDFLDYPEHVISSYVKDNVKSFIDNNKIDLLNKLLTLFPKSVFFMASCEKFTTIFPSIKDNINGLLVNNNKQTFLHKILNLEDSIIILESNINLNVNQIDIYGETFVSNYYDSIDILYKKNKNTSYENCHITSKKIIEFVKLLIRKNYNINYVDNNNRSIINLCFRVNDDKSIISHSTKKNMAYRQTYFFIDYCCLYNFFYNEKIDPTMNFVWLKYMIHLYYPVFNTNNKYFFMILETCLKNKNYKKFLFEIINDKFHTLDEKDIIMIVSIINNINNKKFRNMVKYVNESDGNTVFHLMAKFRYKKLLLTVSDIIRIEYKANKNGKCPRDLYIESKISNILN
ncbi:hypothetical protein QJ850_gp600 [Acanthamoeba polyphaga mimivirus]|uniref:Ankyrin repeat protein n=1 Tax=Acanthamoeba polyphaga mimivirus Kroon TaxID=3069720 RepID=A0A0G2Y6C5_9VIRU|nr:hypothetical protein QJ850_gp600 [Acanthamoeba polyphaga mimivirus]AKI80099.1 hypothetical protein [Acanthamoeba polyphaga mimivirus Kroon]